MQDPSRFLEPKRVTPSEVEYRAALEDYFKGSMGTNVEKLQNFAKYVPVQDLRKFICRHEIFKKILNVQGSVVECGVQFGGGLMTWANLSEIYEPFNFLRKIIGFDTFSGFVSVSDKDKTELSAQSKVGGLAIDSHDDVLAAIELYDKNRVLKHIPKVKVVRG